MLQGNVSKIILSEEIDITYGSAIKFFSTTISSDEYNFIPSIHLMMCTALVPDYETYGIQFSLLQLQKMTMCMHTRALCAIKFAG